MATFTQALILMVIIWELIKTCQKIPHVEVELLLFYSRDALLSLCSTRFTTHGELPEAVRV